MATSTVSTSRLLDAGSTWSSTERAISSFGRHLPPGSAFEFRLPGRPVPRAGDGQVKFRITFNNEKAMEALKSLDEMRIGEAYLFGDLDVDGDLVAALDLAQH